MLNELEFDELNNFQEHFTQATLHYNETVFTWKDLCKPFCDINAMLTKAMVYFLFITHFNFSTRSFKRWGTAEKIGWNSKI